MQSAQLFAELLDLGFRHVLLVFGASEILGDFVQILEDSFESFANLVYLRP
jgi:hypothetical protein